MLSVKIKGYICGEKKSSKIIINNTQIMEETQELKKKLQTLIENEKYGEIIKLLSNELLSTQNNSDLYAWAAWVKLRQHKLQDAFNLAQASIRINPNNSFGYLMRGGVYHETDRDSKALVDYDMAIKLDAYNSYAYGARAALFLDSKEYDEAISDFNKSIELKKDNKRVYINRGNTWWYKGEYKMAIEDYNIAIELSPNDELAYLNRAKAWNKIGEYEKALIDINKSIELNANFPFAYIFKGDVCYAIGEFQESIKNYKVALNLDLDGEERSVEDKIKLAQEAIEELKLLDESSVEKVEKDEKLRLEKEIDQIIISIRDAAKSKVKMVAHYTKLSVADIYVKKINVKMHYSNAIYMNDPMEGKVFFDYLDNDEITKAYLNGEKRTETSVYLGSFLPAEDNNGEVSHEDELVMWRTYGKDENGKEASGCNVVISSDFFKLNSSVDDEESIPMSDNEEELLNVVYVKKLKSSKEITNDNKDKIEPAIVQLRENLLKLIELRNKFQKRDDFYKEIENSIFKRLSTISYLFKSADYNYEHEVRVITYVPRNSDNIRFREIDEPNLPCKHFYIESYNDILPHIKKIYLGPKVEHYQRWSLYLDYEIRQRVKEGMTVVNPSSIEIIKSDCKFQ